MKVQLNKIVDSKLIENHYYLMNDVKDWYKGEGVYKLSYIGRGCVDSIVKISEDCSFETQNLKFKGMIDWINDNEDLGFWESKNKDSDSGFDYFYVKE